MLKQVSAILVVATLQVMPVYAADNSQSQSAVKATTCKVDSASSSNCQLGEVPTPAATWLFALALVGFVGLSNKRRV